MGVLTRPRYACEIVVTDGVASYARGAPGVESAPRRVSGQETEDWRWTRPSEFASDRRCRSSVIASDVIDCCCGVAFGVAVNPAGVRELRSTRMTLTLHVQLANIGAIPRYVSV